MQIGVSSLTSGAKARLPPGTNAAGSPGFQASQSDLIVAIGGSDGFTLAFRRTGCVSAPRRGSMIDRVVQKRSRGLCELPVGFKWFTPGLFDGWY